MIRTPGHRFPVAVLVSMGDRDEDLSARMLRVQPHFNSESLAAAASDNMA